MPLADATFPNDKELVASLDAFDRAEFDKWLVELNRENAARGFPLGSGNLETVTGVECWFAYYKEGTSPAHAIDEECSCD